jgi:2,5-diketo-D-gluconate reductase A
MQRGYAVLTKSTTPKRIVENLNVFGFELSDDAMEKLNAQDKDEHVAWAAVGFNPQALD